MKQKYSTATINTLIYLLAGPTIISFLLLLIDVYTLKITNQPFNPLKFPSNLVFIIIVAIFGYFYLEYRSKKYLIDDTNIFFTQGVYNKKSTTIPLNKVNNVSVNQTLAQQVFGVSTIKFEQEEAEEYFNDISTTIAQEIVNKVQINSSKTVSAK